MSAHRIAALALASLCLAAAPGAAQKGPAQQAKAARPADSVVVGLERSLFAAVEKKDFAEVNRVLGADMTYVDLNGAMVWERAKTAEYLKDCTTGPATMENVGTRRIGNDLIVVTSTVTAEQTCGGKKAPSPVHMMTVWQKRGASWVAVAHSETPAAPKQ